MPVPVGIAIGCASNQKLIAGRARPARAKAPITVNRNIKISRNAPTLSYGKLLVGSRPEINGSVVPSASFFQSLTGTLRNPAKANVGGKVAFVAGATGRAGARVVRELLKAGYKVRAGARDVEAAQRAVDVAEAYGLLTADQIKRLEIVPFNLADAESIRSAIGGARKVVCAVGAPESEAFNFSAPKKIDGEGTIRLIKEAASAGVEQFVMISSLGTGKIGFPASILNLFWGVLSYKREAEKALETSGMNYTIVRPGGMERPPDSYKKTHNVVLSPADTKFGGQVSRLQVAELVSSVLNSPGLASNRILEVTAETTAPRASYSELLQAFAAGAAPAVPKPAGRAPAAASKAAPAAAPAAAAGAAKGGKPERAGLAQRVTAAKEEQSSVKKSTAPVMEAAAQAEEALEQARKELQQAGVSEAVAKRVLEEAKAAAAKGPLSSRDIQQLKQKAAAVEKSAPKPAAAAPKAAAQVEKAVEKAPQPTNIFSRLFGLDKAVTVDEGEKISVPKKDGEEEEAPPARAPAPPAAAPKVQPAPATPKPAAAAPQPKPAAAAPPPPPPVARGPPVPVEDAAEVERRALAAVAEERKAKALAEGKKQLEAEAQAIAETKALAEKIASQKASEAPAPKAAPKAAPKVEAKAAPKAEAKAAPKAEAKAAPKAAPKVEAKAAPAAEPKAEAKPAAPVDNAQVAMNKKAAQEWIAKWQAKQQAPPGTAQSNGGTSGGPEAPDVQQNKKAAQQWIENWRSKQTVK